jgi:hypothetical protein
MGEITQFSFNELCDAAAVFVSREKQLGRARLVVSVLFGQEEPSVVASDRGFLDFLSREWKANGGVT